MGDEEVPATELRNCMQLLLVYQSLKFRDYYNSIASLPKSHAVIEREWSAISTRTSKLWMIATGLITNHAETLMKRFANEFMEKKKELFNLLTLRKTVQDDQLCREIEENIEKIHKEDAELRLKQEYFKSEIRAVQPKTTEDLINDDFSEMPIFFDDIVKLPQNTSTEQSQPQEPVEGVPLVVLCHGIQGSPEDMEPIAEKLREYMPASILMLSRANAADHEAELYLMARRFAEELNEYYKALSASTKVSSINFIAFSTGINL